MYCGTINKFMNYEAHYNKLINRAKQRELLDYAETHHIVPRCAGGSDSDTNLVKLTPEEHYTAHLLLVKIYEHKSTRLYKKLLYACNLMSGKSNIGRKNKMYGWVKRKISIARTGTSHSLVVRQKISKKVTDYFECNDSWLKGKTLTEAHKKKCSEGLSGRTFSKEHKLKISKALSGKKKSEEHRAKFVGKNNPAYIVVSQKTQTQIVDDYNAGLNILTICKKYNYSESKILSLLIENNIDTQIRTCPHCKKTGQTSNMIRWHFDSCKHINTNELTV